MLIQTLNSLKKFKGRIKVRPNVKLNLFVLSASETRQETAAWPISAKVLLKA